jgi:hypothetical protein
LVLEPLKSQHLVGFVQNKDPTPAIRRSHREEEDRSFEPDVIEDIFPLMDNAQNFSRGSNNNLGQKIVLN